MQGAGHQATLIDPLENQLPLLEKMYKEYEQGQAPEVLERLATRIRAADAFIIVSGEYNHSIPRALQSAGSLPGRVFLAAIGHRLLLRGCLRRRSRRDAICAMLCELGTPSIPSLLPIPRVQDAFDEAGHPRDESYNQRAARFLSELEWYAGAVRPRDRREFLIEP